MSRIGVFVCHCGHNIAGTVDVEAVARLAANHPDVAFATDYKYMCSDPGQQLIRDSISELNLDGVVVAACSPAMHETTFRRTVSSAGLNPYRCESANVREQVSWVHQDCQHEATAKAVQIARSIVEKVKANEELEPLRLPLTRRALVIGGGIAGIQAALDLPMRVIQWCWWSGAMCWAERWPSYLGHISISTPHRISLKNGSSVLLRTPKYRCLWMPRWPTCRGTLGISESWCKHRTAVLLITRGVLFHATVGPDSADSEPTGYSFTFDIGAIIVATGWEPYDQSLLPEYGWREFA